MPGQTIRTFIALEIEEKIKERIFQIQNNIKQSNCLQAKWVQKDNLHLTLKFLGDTKIKYLDEIKDKIREAFSETAPINCSINEIGSFPNERFPKIIWIGINEEGKQLAGLAYRLEESLSFLGFKKEKREFKTHITICRTKQITNQNQLKSLLEQINKDFKPLEFTANKITFFESKLTPHGPIYTCLFNYFLKKNPGGL